MSQTRDAPRQFPGVPIGFVRHLAYADDEGHEFQDRGIALSFRQIRPVGQSCVEWKVASSGLRPRLLVRIDLYPAGFSVVARCEFFARVFCAGFFLVPTMGPPRDARSTRPATGLDWLLAFAGGITVPCCWGPG